MRGRLRFGSADDLALTQLPQILRDFRQLYPQINLELTVNQSGVLARRLKAGQLDLVFIKQEPDQPDGRVVRRERLVWVAHKSLQLEPDQPVPLIVYQAPSLSRQRRDPRPRGCRPHLAHHLQRPRDQRRAGGAAGRNRRGGVPAEPDPRRPRAGDLEPSGCRCSARSTSPCSTTRARRASRSMRW